VTRNTSLAGRLWVQLVVLAATTLLLTPLMAPAQTVDVVRAGQAFELRYTATFAQDELTFGQALGYDTVSLPDGACLTEPGKPRLPTRTLHIALPPGMAVTNVRLVRTETIELAGEYLVFPAQPPRRMSDPARATDFVPPDPATYAASSAYPAETVTLIGQADLAGQALAVVQVCPLQYVPAQRHLTLCTAVSLVLEGVDGYTCGDYLPEHISDAGRDFYERALTTSVVNPDDVELHTAGGAAPAQRGVGPGDYDYVIVTTSDWVSAFQPLADWKTKKGVPANIVTTTWIYSAYSGSNNVDKIRAFVLDAYTNWGTTFFLMGGDTTYVPCHFKTIGSVDPDPIPNDTYYADFDSDWVCEVNVGRASVNGTGNGSGGIGSFISKVFTYEKNPPTTNYPRKAGFFGFDLDSGTPTEDAKIAIGQQYMPPPWSVTGVYDSQTGNHLTNVIAAINAGQMLMNHSDHSSSDFMGTGYVNHGWGLGNGDMDALTNGNRQGIMYSMGCDPAAFDYSVCIAEHFVRNINGGGVAFIGNSRYGWYNPGNLDTLSLLYDKYFFRSLVQQNWYKLGAAVLDHKNDYFPSDDYYKYIWTELTLLGDPELPVWTSTMASMTVTHPSTLDVGVPNTFVVQVNSGSTPVSGATVCLWKAGDIYQIMPTNSGGTATFTVTPASIGTMSVTVTRQGRLPYEGTASVVQPTSYTLTVNVSGAGTVTLNPPGGTYPANTSVQLTAHPAAGSRFDQWSGDLDGSTNPATIVMDGNKNVWAAFGLIGDMNCDGVVDIGDINPFVLALTDPTQYQQMYPDCYIMNADINQDGVVDFGDINAFVVCLSSDHCP